jgi:adenosylcobinamide kinase/adenosylcobinamide-phosphate guanylyltransferase
MLELILGGARSGKSRHAEHLAAASGQSVVYIATATAGDAAMAARIEHHRANRPRHWQTIEVPVRLAPVLREHAAVDRCLLVDCLTLWLSNCLVGEVWDQQRRALLDVLPELPGIVLLVSNEVGQGVVPMGELSRQFVDEAGRLHQDLAGVCNRVTFVTAGIPQILKDVNA